jgi:ribosomal subunit interface protein
MKITIKATNLDVTPPLRIYIEEKLGTLAKFIKSYDEAGSAELALEVARTSKHHQKGLVYKAEGRLPLPGKMLYSAQYHDDMRKAIDALKRVLRIEIEKYKSKHAVKSSKAARDSGAKSPKRATRAKA